MFILEAVLSFAFLALPYDISRVSLNQTELIPLEQLKRADSLEIVFVGNQFFSSHDLWSQMQLKKEAASPSKLFLEKPDHSSEIELNLQLIKEFLGSQGFLLAQCELLRLEVDQGNLKLVVKVSEGLPYRIGKIEIAGARYFSAEQIIQLSQLSTGEILNAKLIQRNVYTGISLAYKNEGYWQAEVDFVPQFIQPLGSNIGIVNIKLEIDEGRLFRIRKISFLGQNKAHEEMLWNQVLLQTGSVMRHSLLLATLQNLNSLCLYEPLLEKHLILRTNDKNDTVDLDIQFTAKEHK